MRPMPRTQLVLRGSAFVAIVCALCVLLAGCARPPTRTSTGNRRYRFRPSSTILSRSRAIRTPIPDKHIVVLDPVDGRTFQGCRQPSTTSPIRAIRRSAWSSAAMAGWNSSSMVPTVAAAAGRDRASRRSEAGMNALALSDPLADCACKRHGGDYVLAATITDAWVNEASRRSTAESGPHLVHRRQRHHRRRHLQGAIRRALLARPERRRNITTRP